MTMDYDWTMVLRSLGACPDAQAWANATRGPASAAWANCPRGDWMLWIAAEAGVDWKLVVLAACDCARLALPLFEARCPDDARPRRVIEVTEAWTRGEATIEQVRAAAADADAPAAAYAAAYAADADADAREGMQRRCAIAVAARVPIEVIRAALLVQAARFPEARLT